MEAEGLESAAKDHQTTEQEGGEPSLNEGREAAREAATTNLLWETRGVLGAGKQPTQPKTARNRCRGAEAETKGKRAKAEPSKKARRAHSTTTWEAGIVE